MASMEDFDINGILSNLMRFEPTAEEKQKAQTMAMLKSGLGILAQGGPSMTPRSFGQIAGQAGMQGLDAYDAQLRQQMADRRGNAQNALAGAQIMQKMGQEKRLEQAGTSLKEFLQSDQGKDPQAIRQMAAQFAVVNPQTARVLNTMAEQIENKRKPQAFNRTVVGPNGMPTERTIWAAPGEAIPDTEKPVTPVPVNRGDRIEFVNPNQMVGNGLSVNVSPNTIYSQGQENARFQGVSGTSRYVQGQENQRQQTRPILVQGTDDAGGLSGVLTSPQQIQQAGGVLSTGLRPIGLASAANTDERTRQRILGQQIDPYRRQLGAYEQYQQAKETWKGGESVPPAVKDAANQFIQMTRNSARFKDDMDSALGGGSIAQRVVNSISKIVTGEPSREAMADLDLAMNAMAKAAAGNIGTTVRNVAVDAQAANLKPSRIVGGPKVFGNIIILPDGRVITASSSAEAKKGAELWVKEHANE